MPSGGGGTWGSITGTLSAQTDLQSALDLKAPLASPTFTGTVVLPSTTSIGTVSNTEISYLDGVTSAIQTQFTNKQPLDADLSAIAALSSTGFAVRTASNTWAQRTITVGNASLTISNGNGVSGNPALHLNVANANTWSAQQIFDKADSSSGVVNPSSNLVINYTFDGNSYLADGSTRSFAIYSYQSGVYDIVGTSNSAEDPGDFQYYAIDLSWDDASVDGYYVYDQNNDQYVDVGNVTSYQANYMTSWNAGPPPSSPSTFTTPANSLWSQSDKNVSTQDINAFQFGSYPYRFYWDYTNQYLRFEDSDTTLKTIRANINAANINASQVTSSNFTGGSFTGTWGGNVITTNRGGTGISTWQQGDMSYYTSGTAFTKLAKNTTASRVITNTGTNNAPAWGQVNLANGVTDSLPNANLANSTISGVALGGTLANLTATNTTLTFSGTYTGATARTIGINLSTSNTWAATITAQSFIATTVGESFVSTVPYTTAVGTPRVNFYAKTGSPTWPSNDEKWFSWSADVNGTKLEIMKLYAIDATSYELKGNISMAPNGLKAYTGNGGYVSFVYSGIDMPTAGITTYENLKTDGVLKFSSSVADGASAIGMRFNTSNAFSTVGSKLFSLQNNSSEKMYVDKDGIINSANLTASKLLYADTSKNVSSMATFGYSPTTGTGQLYFGDASPSASYGDIYGYSSSNAFLPMVRLEKTTYGAILSLAAYAQSAVVEATGGNTFVSYSQTDTGTYLANSYAGGATLSMRNDNDNYATYGVKGVASNQNSAPSASRAYTYGLWATAQGHTSGNGGATVYGQALSANIDGILIDLASSQTAPAIHVRDNAGTSLFTAMVSNSTGAVTFDSIGSGARFTFADGITLSAGTATAGTSPLKFTSGTLLTTPEDGALEYDGAALYLSLPGVRRSITTGNDTRVADATVTNTTTETTIHTSTIAANSLKVGKMYKITLLGKTTTVNASQFYTLRFKMGGTTLITVAMAAANVTDAHFKTECFITIRTIGAGGTYAAHVEGTLGTELIAATPVTGSVDTTAAEDMTTTLQWDAANAGNTFTIMQSALEVIN